MELTTGSRAPGSLSHNGYAPPLRDAVTGRLVPAGSPVGTLATGQVPPPVFPQQDFPEQHSQQDLPEQH